MVEDEEFEDFECAFSEERHFYIDPLRLNNCGHSICKNCLPTDRINSIKCKLCGITTEHDMITTQTTKSLKQSFKLNFHRILNFLEDRTARKIEELKDNYKSQVEIIEMKIKYLEDEIDVRVESIKDQIEQAGENVKKKLREMKKEVFKLDGIDFERKIDFYNYGLQELQNNIKSNIIFSEKFLDKIQKNLKDIISLIDQTDNFQIPEIQFSNFKVSETVIGEIYFVDKNKKIDVAGLLKYGRREIIDIDVQPYNIIVFPNNQILSSNCNDKCLTLYDQNLSLVKRIDRINGEEFAPVGIAIDEEEKTLYISDTQYNRILMTNLEFHKIKALGSTGSADNQFNTPSDLCFQNNHLYVCDYHNKRIQIYSKKLELLKSLKLDCLAWKIKASNSILCIESGYPDGLHFFSIKNLQFMFKKNYNHGVCRISEINSCFYELSHKLKKVYCYDMNGNLKEEIILNGVDHFLTCTWDGNFIDFNQTLLMTCLNKKKIIKFTKKEQKINI